METINVTFVRPGDVLVNHGVVTATTRVGVFVVIAVTQCQWSLGKGTGDGAVLDVVRHVTEEVVVIRGVTAVIETAGVS